MKNAVFWDVAPCRFCVNRRFGGKYRLHLQGRKIRERGTSESRWLQSDSLHFTDIELNNRTSSRIYMTGTSHQNNCKWQQRKLVKAPATVSNIMFIYLFAEGLRISDHT
jgi:hypothetical protein